MLLPIGAAACLTRPVVQNEPTTNTNVEIFTGSSSIDKVDLLFVIDNSSSMGDKEQYLAEAIPNLVARFVDPRCVDPAHPRNVVGDSKNGACATGRLEFPPVHDLHIGVLSSSLGARLGSACQPDKTHAYDDDGRLVTRGAKSVDADAQASGFLAWFPNGDANAGKTAPAGAVTDSARLRDDFQDLVVGVGENGCGLESQLESFYRFLVQPDPYDHLDLDGDHAKWVGVDGAILKQRRDFLRPDSLVAVVVLSDENDSEVDVRAFDGQGWKWLSGGIDPSRGTAACATSPYDPACTSCDALSKADQAKDPSCAKGAYSAENDWGYDLNLRHVHMKQKYGVDPQFPIERYVVGLSGQRVPNRDGEYPPGAHTYVGKTNCTNPLFAASLPDGSDTRPETLCNLTPGKRRSDMVFYAHIGGVPHELLHFVPGDAAASALSDADWAKILGRDPEHGDYSGIDAHMIEAFAPRQGLPPPSAANDADPVHGREWITDSPGHLALNGLAVDRQYACTFRLKTPRDCSQSASSGGCDCNPTPAPLGHDAIPPVCDATTPTLQVRAKAYPTIRELLLAKKLGAQGLVSSICPIHTEEEAPGDPLYGYSPAVASIVDRLAALLGAQCIPRALDASSGQVPCRVLAALPDNAATCDPKHGLSETDADSATGFLAELAREGSPAQSGHVCELGQLPAGALSDGTCALSSSPGWCYAHGDAAAPCAQALVMSQATSLPSGAVVRMVCLESSTAK